jgi:hypothetical protein
VATSAQEFVLCAADHSVLRCLLPDLFYPSDTFSLQSEAHTSPLSSATLTNSHRQGKSFCKATTLSYSPSSREGFFSEISPADLCNVLHVYSVDVTNSSNHK